MSSIPRVQRMVMFKHGVAYLERGGPADGSFELSFERAEMNDVLKSLAVWVAQGDGKVGAVGFEKPEDPEKLLAERKLLLPQGNVIAGLLGSLRGRRIRVGEGATRHEGEVIGVDEANGGDDGTRRRLVLRSETGRVAILDLALVQGIELLDVVSRADLELIVDRSRAATAGESRTVSVSLAGRADDLRVSYVIPAPVWRVSYRLARDAARTVLMAWGIVHNPADEDLTDIDLTLTTGQPVSFQIDLYHPKTVERAMVEETSRAVAGPRQFERAALDEAATGMRRRAPPPPMMAAPMPAGFGAPQAPGFAMSDQLGSMAEGAVDYADRGELFEYRLASKVSLKRGGSAMVPLFSSELDAKKERIWREGAGASPDLVITFANTTGAVIEEGPAVIYDESVYAGEAMVPYSARGVAVKLAFAKDLGVRCRREATFQHVVTGVRLGPQTLLEQSYREQHITLTAESDHEESVDVVFELPKVHGRALDAAHAQPFEVTASFHRFSVSVPSRSKASVKVVERWPEVRRIEYAGIDAAQVQQWFEQRFLDAATVEALSAVRLKWDEARAFELQQTRAERELGETYTKQTKLSEQLAVLKEGGQEGALRLRYVGELSETQDRVNAKEAEIQRLRDGAAAARAEADLRLRRLVQG